MTTRETDWAALHDPASTPEQLAAIAQRHPDFASAIAAHPRAYPALREWALAVATPTEAAVLASGPVDDDARRDGRGSESPTTSKRSRRRLWVACAVVLALVAGVGIAGAIATTAVNNAVVTAAEESQITSDCDRYLALTPAQRSAEFADRVIEQWDETGLSRMPVTALYDAQCPAHAGENYSLWEFDMTGDGPRCDVFLGLTEEQQGQWAADLATTESWGLPPERSSADDLNAGCRELALPTQNMVRLSNYLVDLVNRTSWRTQTQLGYSWNAVLGVGRPLLGPEVVPLGGDTLMDGGTTRVYTPGSSCGFDPATDAIVPLRLLLTSTTGDADPIPMSAGWTLRVREGAQPVSRAFLEADFSSGTVCSDAAGSVDGARTFVGYNDPDTEIWSESFSVVLRDFVSPRYPTGAAPDLSAYELVATSSVTRSEDPVVDMTPAVIRLDGSRP